MKTAVKYFKEKREGHKALENKFKDRCFKLKKNFDSCQTFNLQPSTAACKCCKIKLSKAFPGNKNSFQKL